VDRTDPARSRRAIEHDLELPLRIELSDVGRLQQALIGGEANLAHGRILRGEANRRLAHLHWVETAAFSAAAFTGTRRCSHAPSVRHGRPRPNLA